MGAGMLVMMHAAAEQKMKRPVGLIVAPKSARPFLVLTQLSPLVVLAAATV